MTPANRSLQIKALGKEILDYNLLTAFPLSDGLIKAYAEKLLELSPNVTPENIHIAINAIILGHIDFDRYLGIQNIVAALYSVRKARLRLQNKYLNNAKTHEEYEHRLNNPLNLTEKEIIAEIADMNAPKTRFHF